MSSSIHYKELSSDLAKLVPTLGRSGHKGLHGKLGVIGGCQAYTGAPFFAAMSAMRVGADLAYVFCTPSASPVIKSYSPETIVLPLLPELPLPKALVKNPEPLPDPLPEPVEHQQLLKEWLAKARLGCLVVGPGLGDDPLVVATAKAAVAEAREKGLHIVIDGSGLNFIAKEPQLIAGYDKCILTPNLPELGRLADGAAVKLEGSIGVQWQKQVSELAHALGGVVVLSKGPEDVISDGATTIVVDQEGSLARAGGQGDVLAGTVGTMVCWSLIPARIGAGGGGGGGRGGAELNSLLVAAAAGSLVTRLASHEAFVQKGRSMVAGDLLPQLRGAVDKLEGLGSSKM